MSIEQLLGEANGDALRAFVNKLDPELRSEFNTLAIVQLLQTNRVISSKIDRLEKRVNILFIGASTLFVSLNILDLLNGQLRF